MAGVVRLPGLRIKKVITSPHQEGAQFTIRQATNREDIERLNLFSKTFYHNRDDGMVMERDTPLGDLQMMTIKLCLVDWNLLDEAGRVQPLSDDNLLDLLYPDERVWLYEQILVMNPMWQEAPNTRREQTAQDGRTMPQAESPVPPSMEILREVGVPRVPESPEQPAA